MIKLIVSDIDGTLVPEGTNCLNPELFDVISQLKKKNIFFCVASGRHKNSIENLFEPVKNDILYITSNGAYTGSRETPLYVSGLTPATYNTLYADFRRLGYKSVIETTTAAYTDLNDAGFADMMINDYGYTLKHIDSCEDIKEDIIKLSLYHPSNVNEVSNDLIKQWSKLCRASVSGIHWIDFMSHSINKGAALLKLQEKLQVQISETLAFGDQINDIEMLKQAYFSYAVKNAKPIVKNAARFCCEPCENDGVIRTIQQLASL